MTTHRLFAYGTLQSSQIVRLIVGRDVPGVPASLSGYVRYCVIDRCYPAIIEACGGEVPGVVYSGLDADDLRRLDDYEGSLYERRQVTVSAATEVVQANTYVLRARHGHRLSREPWDLTEFEQEHLASYLARIADTGRAP